MWAKHTFQIRSYLFFLYTIFLILFLIVSGYSAEVTLIWDANEIPPDGYRIFQRTESGTYDYSTPNWSGTETMCTLYDLVEGETYYYVVRAFIGVDESTDSNEIAYSVGLTAAPGYTISSSAQGNGSISPSGIITVAEGSSQSYGISSQTGYLIKDVLVDGQSVGAVTAYTFTDITTDHTITAMFDIANMPPVADAGPDQTVFEAQPAVLSAAGSMDEDDGIAIFQWRQIQGPAVVLSSTSGEETTFTAPSVGIEGSALIFELTVTDNSGASATDTCTVNVANVNIPPIADAGPDQTLTEGSQVYLDGSGSHDDDDGIAAYQWVQTQGIAVMLSDSASAKPFFQLPIVGDGGTALAFELTVTDAAGGTDTDNCIVTIQAANKPPVADAGPDQTVFEAQTAVLSATNSLDEDDGIAMFQWRQIQGTSVVLSSTTGEEATFTAPNVGTEGVALIFELLVTDYSGASATDTCIVNVANVNMPPTADAGPDQTLTEGGQAYLNGSGSYDNDDGIAAYQWKQTQGPAVILSDNLTANPSFQLPTVDSSGTSVTFELTVTDASGLQDTDSCIVTIQAANKPPVADAGPDLKVSPGEEVTLDGTGSSDPDDGIAGYRWRQTDGNPVVLSDAASPNPVFTAPVVGTDGTVLTFELTVTDQGNLKSVDNCQVNVLPNALQPEDMVPPEITILDPAADFTELNAARINITGNAWDDVNVDRIVWENDFGQSGTAEGTTAWQIINLDLEKGLNTITITVYDGAGNRSSATIEVYRGKRR